MVVKNVASSKTDAQRDCFLGLSAPSTLDDVRNSSSFDLSDFIHVIYPTLSNHAIIMT